MPFSDQFSSETDVSMQTNSFLHPRNFERTFPSSHGMKNLVACVNQIHKVYPNFKVPRRDTDRYGRNLTIPITAQRISEGLFLCGIRDHHLKQNPDLVLNSTPAYVSESELAQMSEIDLSKMDQMSHCSTVCRGHFIQHYIQHITKSLDLLGFEEACDDISRIQFSRFKNSLTLRELFAECSRPVYKIIANRNKYDVDIEAFMQLVLSKRKIPKGPVQVARNFYIYDQILGQSNPVLKSKRGEKDFSDFIAPEPLETLINLNTFYEIVRELDNHYSDTEKFLKSFVKSAMYTIKTPPKNLPFSVRQKLLADIGFTESEIVEIFMSPRCCKYSDMSTNLLYTSTDFVPTMSSRLKILRAEASNLGLSTAHEFWAVLTNWASVMQDLAHILDSKESGPLTASFNHSVKIKISSTENLPRMRITLPSIKFLGKFFGCTSRDEVKKLMKDTFPTICFPSVPLNRIHQTLDRLVERGFTKEQIRSATPLLCYPPSLVEQKLNELHLEQDRDRLLQICLYSIEREFNFTSDGLFVSGSCSYQFSAELKNEVNKYSSNKAKTSDDDDDDTDENHTTKYLSSFHNTSSFGSSNRICLNLQASSRLFSSHSGTGSFIQKRQIFTGIKGLVLQNPLQWLKVSAELVNLQREWDPSFKKNDFIDGTKQALVAVTGYIRHNQMSKLSGLLTVRERARIQTEIETEWKDIHRNNIDLNITDIVSALPVRVQRHYVAYQKFADVDILFVVNRVRGDKSRRVLMVFCATFTRDYSEGRLPEWTISKLKLEKFSMLQE